MVGQTTATEVRIDKPNFTEWNARVPFRTADEDEAYDGDDIQWSETREDLDKWDEL